MQMYREIRKIESDELVISIPKKFRKKRVEVIILPVKQKKGKTVLPPPKSKFSREIDDFLSLGGSGGWEGNLDEMRETRDGIEQIRRMITRPG